MTRPRRLYLVALLALAAGLASPAWWGPAPAGARTLVVGIGDQTPDVFHDPRFLVLGIHAARLSVAWDVFDNRAQTRALNEWLRAALADGVSPLISFDHHAPSELGHTPPTPGQLAHAFRIFRARYPWVHDFATWNEANFCGEPTCHRPGLVASYYRVLRRTCPSCTVLGAELLDQPGMVTWVRAFDRALGGQPAIWGLHNYIGANRLQVGSTLALLRATRSEIWFTETGGVVARHNDSRAAFPQSPSHAATVTSFIFNRLARLSPRITRVYLYQWNAGPGAEQGWDSGLVGPEPTYAPRPAFATFVRLIAGWPDSPLTAATMAALLQRGRPVLAGGLLGPGDPGAAEADPLDGGTVVLRSARGGPAVATETVQTGQRFAFAVAPGRYVLTAVLSSGRALGVTPLTPASTGAAPGGVLGAAAPCSAVRVSVQTTPGLVANIPCPAAG